MKIKCCDVNSVNTVQKGFPCNSALSGTAGGGGGGGMRDQNICSSLEIQNDF